MRGKDEAKVGVVVVGALALLAGGYAFLRQVGFGRSSLYYLALDRPATIAIGNDVLLQGVKVGQVREVSLDPKTQKPIITIAINGDEAKFPLSRRYKYQVRQKSLLGENYVDIRGEFDDDVFQAGLEDQRIPGTAAASLLDVSDQVTKKLDTLTGQFGKEAELTGAEFRTTLRNLNVTLNRVNNGVLNYENQRKIASALDGVARLTKQAGQGFGPQGIKITLGDEAARQNLNRTFASAAAAANQADLASRNINGLTRNLGGVLEENRRELNGLLKNFSRVADNAAGLTESLAFLVRDGKFKENSEVAFQALRRSAENVEAATGGFRTLATDANAQKDLKDTLTALRVTTESLRDTAGIIKGALGDPTTQAGLRTTLISLSDTAASLNIAMKNLAELSGGLKQTIGDPALQANLKASAENLAGTLAATRTAAERVNALLGGKRARQTTQDGTQSGTGSTVENGRTLVSEIPSGVDFTLRRFTSNVRPRNFGDLNFQAEFLGAPFRLGLANIGDGDDLTLQGGKFIGRNAAVRAGIYRSKLGAGAQFQKGRFGLEANAWDLNQSSYNVYGGLKLTPQFEVLVGREKIGSVRTNSLGVRLRP